MVLKLAARRLLSHRRAAVAASVAALALTLVASAFADNRQTIGPTLLLPWVALLAFQVGPRVGTAAALVSFCLFVATSNGLVITPSFVVGRLAAFSLIGLGLGIAGKRLRDSERRSRRLIEGLPLVMYTEDADGLTYIGPQIEALVGYPVSAWLAGGLWPSVLHEDDRDRVLAQYASAVAGSEPFDCEYRLVADDGRTVWVRDSSAAVADRAQCYRQGFIVDITAQKESELKLERNAVLMRGLIDRTIDGITLTDREGRIVIANEPMLRFVSELDMPREGLIHERLLGLSQHMAEPEQYAQRMRELAAEPDVESFDEFELRESGRVFQGFTRAVVTDRGEFLGRVWTLRDITETRALERVKDALLATVSHELRTPLTSVIGYLELLGTGDTPLSEEDATFVEIASRGAARLERMVEDLLFLARVDAEGLVLKMTQVDLVEAAREAIASARPDAASRQIELHLEERAPLLVDADAARVSQILDNLISNAIKFTPDGGPVRISFGDGGGAAFVSVTDTGRGIPEGEQDQVFNRFFRSSATTHMPGTGLGLAIVQAIVEAHGGVITLHSVENEGTTFTVSVPAAIPSRRAAALQASVL